MQGKKTEFYNVDLSRDEVDLIVSGLESDIHARRDNLKHMDSDYAKQRIEIDTVLINEFKSLIRKHPQ